MFFVSVILFFLQFCVFLIFQTCFSIHEFHFVTVTSRKNHAWRAEANPSGPKNLVQPRTGPTQIFSKNLVQPGPEKGLDRSNRNTDFGVFPYIAVGIPVMSHFAPITLPSAV